MDDEKPDTSHFVLKPKVIIPTDRPASTGDGTAISVQLIHRENQLAEAKAARKRKGGEAPALRLAEGASLPPIFRPKDITPMDPPAKRDDDDVISVPKILLENRIAEEKSGWGRIKKWTRRKSRRTRDFLIVVGGTDLALVFLMKAMPSVMTAIYGISAITLVTSMGGWILFVVMDDF